MIQAPNRVLIAADVAADGVWRIGPRRHCGTGLTDLLDDQLRIDLKRWSDTADTLFGGRVGPERRNAGAIAHFYDDARTLAGRVQDQLGDDWQVLWSHSEPDWCWSWVPRPAVGRDG